MEKGEGELNGDQSISIVDQELRKVNDLSNFIGRVIADDRLKPIHLSIALVLYHNSILNQFHHSYFISRSSIMRTSRIRSKATYHKVIRELQELGYIKYSPSYHPMRGSMITIITS